MKEWTDVEKAMWILENGSPYPRMEYYSYMSNGNRMLTSRAVCAPWLAGGDGFDHTTPLPAEFVKVNT